MAHLGHAHSDAGGHLSVREHHRHAAGLQTAGAMAAAAPAPAPEAVQAAAVTLPCDGRHGVSAAGPDAPVTPPAHCPADGSDGGDPSDPCCLAHCIASHLTGVPVLAVQVGPSVRASTLHPVTDLRRDGIALTPPSPPPLSVA